jgi:hypothetical protein
MRPAPRPRVTPDVSHCLNPVLGEEVEKAFQRSYRVPYSPYRFCHLAEGSFAALRACPFDKLRASSEEQQRRRDYKGFGATVAMLRTGDVAPARIE